MLQRFTLIITVAVVVVLLVVLNAASYVGAERAPDTEFNPDRSTYNGGATGTLALYQLLGESGRKVIRWGEKPQALLNTHGDNDPDIFVVIGKTRIRFDEDEVASLLKWVQYGGRLVVIDRRPDPRLLPRSEKWSVSTNSQELPKENVHPDNSDEMTAGVSPIHPTQPGLLTRGVESVLPSRFAGTINISAETQAKTASSKPSPTPDSSEDDGEEEDEPPPSPPPALPRTSGTPPPAPTVGIEINNSPAPVTYMEDKGGALLADYQHGAGRITILSDPYVVANGGLRLVDNLRLAINTVTGGRAGIIAFDEYHQGRGAQRNQLFAYFEGTPVLWMLAQVAFIVLALLWTRGQRFARPLPVARVDRRSSLEFVASMAELQQRARAYDLAIENIYTRLRRVLVRQAGLSHNSPRSEIAARAAARSDKLNASQLETLMRECEEVINGAPVDTRKALELVRELRRTERILGLRTRSREARQAAEGLQQTTI